MLSSLDHLHETTIAIHDHRYVVRSEIRGTVGKVFEACGVAIPPAVRPAWRAPSPRSKKLDRRDTT
jgi:hypothetical protein